MKTSDKLFMYAVVIGASRIPDYSAAIIAVACLVAAFVITIIELRETK